MAIRVELELEDGQFTTRMIRAGETVQQFQRSVGQGITSMRLAETQTKSLLSTMRDFTIVTGAAGFAINGIRQLSQSWVGDIVRVNAEMERLRILMKGMSNAADPLKAAAEQVKFLRDMSKEAPYSLKALSEAFVRMKSTGIDPMGGALRSLVDGVAAFGGTEDILKRASVSMQQMAGKGVIQMEELRQQLGEAIPRATELMARSVGVSYGELVEKISRGTVAAKPALEALQREISRVFGGTALEQMNTFNGLIAQSRTLMQELAIHMGDTGFFDGLKAQIRDFNQFIQGAMAKDFGAKIASGMMWIVNTTREVIEWVIRFRQEIAATIEVMAYGFGASLVISGMVAIGRALGNLIALVTAVRAAWAGVTVAAGAAGAAQAGAATAAAAGGLAGLARVLPLVAGGLAAVAGFLPLLAGGLFAAATAFGFFSNKAKDAYDDVSKFGANSEDQLKEAEQYVEDQQKILDKLIARREYFASRVIAINKEQREKTQAQRRAELNEEFGIGEKQAAQNARKMELEVAARQFKEKQSQLAANESMRILNDSFREEQRQYDIRQNELAKKSQAERNAAAADGRDVTGIQDLYAREQRQLALDLYDFKLERIEEYYNNAIEKSKNGDKALQSIAALELEKLKTERDQVLADRQAVANTPLGVQEIAKVQNFDEKFKKGQQLLEKLKAETAGFKAELVGVNAEVIELQQIMDAGKYGNAEVAQVKELVAQILRAQAERERYNEIVEGNTKLEKDLADLTLKMNEDLLEMREQGMTKVEQLQNRLSSGFYTGASANKDGVNLDELRKKLEAAGLSAEDVNQLMKAGVFGEETKTAGKGLIDVINQIGDAWNMFRMSVDNTDLATPLGAWTQFARSGGGAAGPSSSFTNALFGAESGGDNNAKNPNSSATGAGQFTEGTWMQFMNDVHKPLMTDLGKAASLSLRTNEQMSRQATEWNAKKNAMHLQDNGINASDRNLYLSHFLGGGGAEKLLKNPFAKVEDLLSKQVIDANKEVLAGKRSQEVIDWAGRKIGDPMGTRTSFVDDRIVKGKDLELARSREVYVTTQKEISGVRDKITELNSATLNAKEEITNMGDNERKVREDIRNGLFKTLGKNPTVKAYEDIIKAAKEADAAEKERDTNRDNKKDAEAAEANIASKKALLNQRLEASRNNMQPENLRMTRGYVALERELDLELAVLKTHYGEKSSIVQQKEQEIAALKKQFRQVELIDEVAKMEEENRRNRMVGMTASQAARVTYQEEMAGLQNRLELARGAGEDRVALEGVIQERMAQVRKQYELQSPLAQQMKQWADFGNNLENAATGWLDSGIDALTTFVTTGKADFKSLSQSIMNDLTKIALKWAFTSMIGGNKGGGGVGIFSKLFGLAHTGGVIGSSSLRKSFANPAAFLGAPRFHTGGIIKGLGIGPDEVPIIAKKGEGVFTPEQMAALGNGGGTGAITINAPVTVNASGGTPAQNDDLAKKMSAEVKSTVQQIAAEEIRRQMRPNGMLNKN